MVQVSIGECALSYTSLFLAADPGADWGGGGGWTPLGLSKREMRKFTALSARSYSNAVHISI